VHRPSTKRCLTLEDSIATGYPKQQKHYLGARTAEHCSRVKRNAVGLTMIDLIELHQTEQEAAIVLQEIH
jgi:hypothetical protein